MFRCHSPLFKKKIKIIKRLAKKVGSAAGDIVHVEDNNSEPEVLHRKLTEMSEFFRECPSAVLEKLCFSIYGYDDFETAPESCLMKVSENEALAMVDDKFEYQIDPADISDQINSALYKALNDKLMQLEKNESASPLSLQMLSEVYQDSFDNVSLKFIYKKLCAYISTFEISADLKDQLYEDIENLANHLNEFFVIEFNIRLENHINRMNVENHEKRLLLNVIRQFFQQLQLSMLPNDIIIKTKREYYIHELPQSAADEIIELINSMIKSACEIQKRRELQSKSSVAIFGDSYLCISTKAVNGKPAKEIFDALAAGLPIPIELPCGKKETLPVRGLGKIAAIAKILGDPDWLGVDGMNTLLTYDVDSSCLLATIIDVGLSFHSSEVKNFDTRNIFFAMSFPPVNFDNMPTEFKKEYIQTLIKLGEMDLDTLFQQHFVKKRFRTDDYLISEETINEIKNTIKRNIETAHRLFEKEILDEMLIVEPEQFSTPFILKNPNQ